jgi:hypothetical protein
LSTSACRPHDLKSPNRCVFRLISDLTIPRPEIPVSRLIGIWASENDDSIDGDRNSHRSISRSALDGADLFPARHLSGRASLRIEHHIHSDRGGSIHAATLTVGHDIRAAAGGDHADDSVAWRVGRIELNGGGAWRRAAAAGVDVVHHVAVAGHRNVDLNADRNQFAVNVEDIVESAADKYSRLQLQGRSGRWAAQYDIMKSE